MSKFKSVWFFDTGNTENDFKYVMSFFDDSHPKPSFITDGKSPNHVNCHSFNSSDEYGRQVVNLVGPDFKKVIPLWYVYVDDSENEPHTRSIVAYADNKFPDGTIVKFNEASARNIRFSDSVGFVRWFVGDSRMQQIIVSESHRRMGLSVKIIGAADLTIVSDLNWNGAFLNGGDITTEDGEKLRQAWSGSARVTPRIGSSITGGERGI